jgi:hypothetical protein
MVREQKMEEIVQSLYGNMARLKLDLDGVWQALVSKINLG